MEPRSWSLEKSPRIISKYFSGEGGFVADINAEYLPSTGFAWIPKSRLKPADEGEVSTSDILGAYTELFNSSTFGRLLQYYAPHVSGGQFDLSPRYVNAVPLPDFLELLADPNKGQDIRRLADLAGRGSGFGAVADEVEEIIVNIYGPKIIAAL